MKKTYVIALIVGLISTAYAEVELPRVMGSKMVLQRGVPAPIWGWADQGEEVTVRFAGQVKKATPDARGKWMVRLDPMPASAQSRSMTIQGKNTITLQDILVGEVWLASGQSNMEWTFAQIVPEEWTYAQAQKDNPNVRAFHVNQHLSAGTPMDDTEGHWKSCADMVAQPHSVSAVGFFFALKLQQELGIPVAILDANWGGQPIEAFIPPEGYQAFNIPFQSHPGTPDLQAAARQLRYQAKVLNRVADAADRGRRVAFPDSRPYGWAKNMIHNAMIAPLTPYAIKGAIWYQGEANRASLDYFNKLQALSAGWSKVFNVEHIPLYQVQIAPFDYTRGLEPNATMLCDNIWKAQYRGAEEIPGVGVVAIHDVNINVKDIHPRNKRTVGERLAAQALNKQYAKDVVTTGPRFERALRSGSGVVVSFEGIDQGLSTKDGQAPSWFEVSADGQTFVNAEAVIQGNTVAVSAAAVPAPAFVRMGWNEVAIPNLQDKNGWPVFSFPASKVATE